MKALYAQALAQLVIKDAPYKGAGFQPWLYTRDRCRTFGAGRMSAAGTSGDAVVLNTCASGLRRTLVESRNVSNTALFGSTQR